MKWISVKDKLPELDNEPLLVRARDFGFVALAIFVGTSERQWRIYPIPDNIWHTVSNFVSHWMPLPEPPEREAQ